MTYRKIKATEAETAEAVARLRDFFPVGSVVPMTISDISRRGYGARTFTVLAIIEPDSEHGIRPTDRRPYIRNVSRDVATVLGMPFDDVMVSVRSYGCGMDMAFHLAYSLGHALYAGEDGYTLPDGQTLADLGMRGMAASQGSRDAGYVLGYRVL